MKCKDCIWLDFSRKHSVGFECTNPNIEHNRLGYLRQSCSPACKRGFEGYDGQTIEMKPRRTYEQGKQDGDEFLKQWKDDVVESLAKYDAETVEEVYQYGINKGRNDAIDECYKLVARYDDKSMRLNDVEKITDGILKKLEKLKENNND